MNTQEIESKLAQNIWFETETTKTYYSDSAYLLLGVYDTGIFVEGNLFVNGDVKGISRKFENHELELAKKFVAEKI